MISEPSRYLQEFLDAGCDSITIHVEIEEPIEPTLRAIRKAGRYAGLAMRPGTPWQALEPYAHLLDIVLIMTVEPGFGGQPFMGDVLAAKADGARELLSHKLYGSEIHVDGGINRDTVEVAGAHGVDVFVVGSALFLKGRDMGRELRLIRALADEGFQYGRNEGRPPIPHDRMSIIASMPKAFARQFVAEVEATGIPVVMLRGDGQINPDGVRDYDLLVPTILEEHIERHHGETRKRLLRDADAWRASFDLRT